AHPPEHPGERPLEERVLAEEREPKVEREHRGRADDEIPVRRMRRHGDHHLRQVRDLSLHVPAEESKHPAAHGAHQRALALRDLAAQDRERDHAKSAAAALRSTLPPEMMIPTRLPRTSIAPERIPAAASAPVGSTTSFMRSQRKRIASTSFASSTVMMSCTSS